MKNERRHGGSVIYLFIFDVMVWVHLSKVDKVLMIEHIYPTLKQFDLDGSGLFQHDSASIHRPQEVTE